MCVCVCVCVFVCVLSAQRQVCKLRIILSSLLLAFISICIQSVYHDVVYHLISSAANLLHVYHSF